MSHSADDTANALERIKLRARDAAQNSVDDDGGGGGSSSNSTVGRTRHTLVDVSVQFIGAKGLPKMDVIGRADPYFIATIDDRIKFISTVQSNTLNPVWNELWHIKNVPSDGKLRVKVYDKDSGSLTDDYIGICELTLEDGTKEGPIRGTFKRDKGTLWAKVTTHPASSPSLLPYTFDGPVSYSRHFSPTLGHLTHLDANGKRLYSTWKVHIKSVQSFLPGPPQHWNTTYSAAQHIFNPGPGPLAVRTTIQVAHRMLYARSTRSAFGTIESPTDLFSLLQGGRRAPHRVKPAVYTYVITLDDDTLRFSETGAAFFVDFASKHALHANCAQAVRYSGEFHPRPAGGWAAFDEHAQSDADVRWEFVFDNNSGTYSPDAALLPHLRDLLMCNFPGFEVVVLDRLDPALEESREACREYALRCRAEGRKELQPNRHEEGEETLNHRAAAEPQQPSETQVEAAEAAQPAEAAESAPEVMEPAAQSASEAVESAPEAAGPASEPAVEAAESALEKAEPATQSATEPAEPATEPALDKI